MFNQFWVYFVVLAVIFVVVLAIILVAFSRARRKSSMSDDIAGNTSKARREESRQ